MKSAAKILSTFLCLAIKLPSGSKTAQVLYNFVPSFSGIEPPIKQTLFSLAALDRASVVSPPGISSEYSGKYLTPYGLLKHSFYLKKKKKYATDIHTFCRQHFFFFVHSSRLQAEKLFWRRFQPPKKHIQQLFEYFLACSM